MFPRYCGWNRIVWRRRNRRETSRRLGCAGKRLQTLKKNWRRVMDDMSAAEMKRLNLGLGAPYQPGEKNIQESTFNRTKFRLTGDWPDIGQPSPGHFRLLEIPRGSVKPMVSLDIHSFPESAFL